MIKLPPLPYEILKKNLLKQNRNSATYDELLWTQEWLTFRNEIKYRDNETCTKCGLSRYKKMTDKEFEITLSESGFGKYWNLSAGVFVEEPNEYTLKQNLDYPSNLKLDETVQLEVHHKYYIWELLPWEYNKSVLTTLCEKCHEEEHFIKDKIVYSDDSMTKFKRLITCTRCNGKGYIKQYEHVQNGICFYCWGYGGVLEGTQTILYKIK